ncbi:hypothetical protein HMI55_000053 [Coelomomyces lativittatus]|nr:hypothetical protein HMI55_000053 [Coelomomyces lativittatus]
MHPPLSTPLPSVPSSLSSTSSTTTSSKLTFVNPSISDVVTPPFIHPAPSSSPPSVLPSLPRPSSHLEYRPLSVTEDWQDGVFDSMDASVGFASTLPQGSIPEEHEQEEEKEKEALNEGQRKSQVPWTPSTTSTTALPAHSTYSTMERNTPMPQVPISSFPPTLPLIPISSALPTTFTLPFPLHHHPASQVTHRIPHRVSQHEKILWVHDDLVMDLEAGASLEGKEEEEEDIK